MRLAHTGDLTIAAHRGDSYHYYENTMTAFRAAETAGADMIEFDVHVTKDGALVVMHDDTVYRTTDGEGRIADKTLAEIAALNAGDEDHPERVPAFHEVMAWAAAHRMMVNIEIKEYYSEENESRCIHCIEEVIACIEKHGMRERAIINSFDAWVLEYVYKQYGKTYMLHGFYPYDAMKHVTVDPAEYLYCACICGRIKKEKFDYLLERGIEPWVGASITQAAALERCIRYGAKLATVNNPGDAIAKLIALGRRPQ
ncbi:MAG: hypothetical protein IJD59_02820 [Clostridia bacterium]|nr:hypothetical protein [Clostridia bacterium]